MNKWYINTGSDSDVAVSVRIRFARNLADFPFPLHLKTEQKIKINQMVKDSLLEGNSAIAKDFLFYEMDKLTDTEAYSLVERHLISPDFAENREGRALLINKDESVSIMLNEEDHIRLQVMSSGLSLDEAFGIAEKIDTLIENSLNFAFDDKLGYLTECPTNLGTGMRASVMLHLPALEACGTLSQLSSTISKIGLTLRGTYGEGSNVKGSMYQMSNQVTLGISERAAIDNLKRITQQVMEKERTARKSFMQSDNLEDKIYRAYGILKYARILTNDEFMDLISFVRLGASMSILDNVKLETVNELMLASQPASLQKSAGKHLDSNLRDKLRAELVRNKLK